MPCSTLEKTSRMETAATAITGTNVAAIKKKVRRHLSPCRRRKPAPGGAARGVNRNRPDNR
jgi:hypothetical protein